MNCHLFLLDGLEIAIYTQVTYAMFYAREDSLSQVNEW